MTSRPAAPESPETDALLMQHLSPRSKWLGLGRESYREAAVRQVGALIEHARSLERRLSLAQTEIKGHMRVEDGLKARVEELITAFAAHVTRIAELEKDAARWSWWREACNARPNDGGPTAVAEAAFCYQVLIEGSPTVDELADEAIKNYPERALKDRA